MNPRPGPPPLRPDDPASTPPDNAPAPPLEQHCPSARELDDLELIGLGAVGSSAAFTLDGPFTLRLPAELATAGTTVELVDPEGLPLARLAIEHAGPPDGNDVLVGGELSVVGRPAFGPFRRFVLSPDAVQARWAQPMVVPVAGPLTRGDLEHIQRHSSEGHAVVLLAFTGHGLATADVDGEVRSLSQHGLVRATLAAAEQLEGAEVVAVPLAAREGGDASADHQLGALVASTYAGAEGRVLGLTSPADEETDEYPAAVAAVLDFEVPPIERQGLVLFFTGLSGSGKSTLARALHDLILEGGSRSITSLDGDVVRRNLSAGLGFSKADRETNITRIGWVAAEISRHGGVAICSPIAPFAATRATVRRGVEAAGGAFFLIHVATPLEECERRDRKGLYAKARQGLIPEFTGISSPYEVPEDADVSVDTTGRSIRDALADIVTALNEAGYLSHDDLGVTTTYH